MQTIECNVRGKSLEFANYSYCLPMANKFMKIIFLFEIPNHNYVADKNVNWMKNGVDEFACRKAGVCS